MVRTIYYKPNINNLNGKVGRAVLAEIRSAKKPDWDAVKKEADECMARILARRDDERTNR